MYENHEKLSEMGLCGLKWADIKTGRSPMAHDHFQTPPDPPKGYTNPKMAQIFFPEKVT